MRVILLRWKNMSKCENKDHVGWNKYWDGDYYRVDDIRFDTRQKFVNGFQAKQQ